MLTRFWVLVPCLIASLAWAAPPASPVTLTYNVSRGGLMLAEVTDTVTFEGKRFEIKSSGRGAGLLALMPKAEVSRTSEGEINGAGLRPLHYREERGNKERTLGADFDWQTRKLTLLDNGQREALDLPPGSLDRLSFPYSFAFLPKPPDRVRIAMTDGRHLSDYEFKLVGQETVATPLGKFPALHYSRERTGDDPVFDLWLGIDQHLLPLRIAFMDRDGGRFEQVVTRIDFPRS
jgi:hypothetical protein